MKPEWEYRVEALGGTFSGPKAVELESLLNEVAADGWELLHLTARGGSNQMLVILRRERRRRSRARAPSWP